MRTLLAAVALMLVAIPAHAGRKRNGGLPPADAVHDFHTTDRLTPETTFGFEMGIELWDDPLIDNVLGFDIGGHFVSESGFGGYLVVPLSYVSTKDVMAGPFVVEGDSETMLGNLELGGLYDIPVGKRADAIVHLGIALPTAADDEGDLFALVDQPLASTPRYGDLVQRVPNTTYLRLGVSPMGVLGPIFWRADLGLDLEIDDDDDTGVDISPVLRVNLAGGVDFGPVDATAELVTNITNPENDDADETASTFAIGARFDGGNVFPGVALIFPIGFDEPVDSGLDLVIAVSLTARLPERD